MKTVTADDEQRIRIPDAKPRQVFAYENQGGTILLTPVKLRAKEPRASVAPPVRRYTDEEKAAFLLNTAATREEYTEARAEVKAMGLDPKKIKHRPPA